MHVQEDFVRSQFVIKELGRELREPCEGSMSRLKHLVRFLKTRKGEFRSYCVDPGADGIDVWVDSNWA
eukprot:2150034-Lingulodinium_polyedra.AAC.1